MLYPARCKKITVDQSPEKSTVPFFGATWYSYCSMMFNHCIFFLQCYMTLTALYPLFTSLIAAIYL